MLLPGSTTLARLVAGIRPDTLERLWRNTAEGVSLDLRDRLWKLLEVEPGSRISALERLRTAPARVSGPEMVRAMERAGEVAAVEVTEIPEVAPSLLIQSARFSLRGCLFVLTMAYLAGRYGPWVSATAIASLAQGELGRSRWPEFIAHVRRAAGVDLTSSPQTRAPRLA